MIRTGKNNEDMPDFNDMMSEVKQDMERQDLEQSIVDRVPELQQLSSTVDRATTAVINAMLSLERAIEQADATERRVNASVITISGKIDEINDHIDEVMKDAPNKLHVSVSVSDTDMKTIQDMFDKEHKWMIAQMQSHIQEVNTMLVQERRKVRERYREYDGCYLGHYAQWFFWFFFVLGFFLFTTVMVMMFGKWLDWF
jgi:Na+/phosphate symporter